MNQALSQPKLQQQAVLSRIQVNPIAGALGAEIYGVDLSQPLSSEIVAAIRQALLEYLVIFLPEQNLEPHELVAFGRNFGALSIRHIKPSLEGIPEIMLLDSAAGIRTDIWHSDVTFAEKPPLGTILYAKQIPQVGGDTMWANMYTAYEGLSAHIQQLLDGLTAIHGFSTRFIRKIKQRGQVSTMQAKIELPPPMEHPVIRINPETGKKALFVNPAYTLDILGLTETESSAILNFLFEHSTKPEYVCRYRWAKGTVAFWDNRCTMHYAINDYSPSELRLMHRMTILGEQPYGMVQQCKGCSELNGSK